MNITRPSSSIIRSTFIYQKLLTVFHSSIQFLYTFSVNKEECVYTAFVLCFLVQLNSTYLSMLRSHSATLRCCEEKPEEDKKWYVCKGSFGQQIQRLHKQLTADSTTRSRSLFCTEIVKPYSKDSVILCLAYR